MEDKWPILRLCDNRWKLDELASVTYPGYKQSYLDNEGNLKVQVKTEEMDLDNIVSNSDHSDNKKSNNAKKAEDEKSKSNASNHINQKHKALKQAQPELSSRRKKYSISIYISSADILFHLLSSVAGKMMASQSSDIEAESSKDGSKNSDQNAHANDTILFKQDTTRNSTNYLDSSLDFSMEPTCTASVGDNNAVATTVNGEIQFPQLPSRVRRV